MALAVDKPLTSAVLVGRAPELDTLRRLVEQARGDASRVRVALVTGETGIGKSRPVAETVAFALGLGFTIVRGSCFEPDRAVPYAALLDLLRDVCASHPPGELLRLFEPAALFRLLPELEHLVPPAVRERAAGGPAAPALDPEQEQRRLFQMLAQLGALAMPEQTGL